MSTTGIDNLTRDTIKQLLTSIGSGKTEQINEESKPQCTAYDWCKPRYFNEDQLNKIKDFAQTVAETITKKFSSFFKAEFTTTISDISQNIASDITGHVSEKNQNDFYAALGPDDQQPQAFISIPQKTALLWLTFLLGEPESEKNETKELSQLELSLFTDITLVLSQAVVDSLEKYCNWLPLSGITTEIPLVEMSGTDEICKIEMNITKAESENSSQFYIALPCNILAPIAGKVTESKNKYTPEQISEIMYSHIQEINVPVVVKLASISVMFEELMSLQTSDILLLDKSVHEPLELILHGQVAFKGQPAQSAGQQAVLITEYIAGSASNSESAVAAI